MKQMRFLRKIDTRKLRGTVLLRLDFNTEDNWRMEAVLPTIRFLLKHADKIIIVSHKGRPKGAEKRFSLRTNAKTLGRLIKKEIKFIPQFSIQKIKREISDAPPRSVFLLENLRFLKSEENNSRGLAKNLACLADYYVNDAFAVCHRANASVVAVTKFLPSYAGLELEKEIKFLSAVMRNPKKPLVLVLGGGKAKDKLGVIKYFRNRADSILMGGAPANTLLFLNGLDVKKSLVDRDHGDIEKLRPVLKYRNLFLPADVVFRNDAILDIGPRTSGFFLEKISKARTIIWNGPMGFIEKTPYGRGTLRVARAIAKNKKAFSLAGGGETVMFLKKYGLDKKFGFISTGGGAMLEFLAGKTLPGIKALQENGR